LRNQRCRGAGVLAQTEVQGFRGAGVLAQSEVQGCKGACANRGAGVLAQTGVQGCLANAPSLLCYVAKCAD